MNAVRWIAASTLLAGMGATQMACSSSTPPPSAPGEPDSTHSEESETDQNATEPPDEIEVVADDEEPSEPSSDAKAPPKSETESPSETSLECQGAPTEATLASLRKRGASSRGCFSALLKRGTEAKGQVKVVLQLSAEGAVEKFDVQGDDPGDVAFTECLAAHFKAPFSEAPPEGGCVTVKIPLNFSVKKSG